MRTVDQIAIRAPLARVFDAAARIERWPEILSHYRWVRFLERDPSGLGGLVEMAAWRPFGPVRYPAWWVSQMTVDRAVHEIRYRHVRGITRGMDVVWRLEPQAADGGGGVDVAIVHQWTGPTWPVVGKVAAELVIGPVFIHGIASRTLTGIKRAVEGGS
ncbi:MAG TPA: SRPBCC family protein [Gemmatimonadales bacterium]|nr:SRPBCC family protein [Gemmatimonadales bacterium]